MCVRSGSWIGLGIVIGTRSCACVGRWDLIPVPISSVGVGFYSAFPAFLFFLIFFSVPFMMCPLPTRRSDYFEFVLHQWLPCGWLGAFSSYFFFFTSFSFTRCARVYFGELVFSMSIHFLDCFFAWIVLHPLRFAAERGRDVRTAFSSSYLSLDWNGACTSGARA
jgi:hypothetical protein